MTEKQTQALQTIIAALPGALRASHRQVAEYAISLGYMPALKGTRKDYVDFSRGKVGRTILKINANPGFEGLSAKFYALPAYEGIFRNAIDARYAYWQKLGYPPRCFGCGKCDGTHGYPFTLPDGGRGFLCGFGVLPLPGFCADDIPAVKAALKTQDAFFMKLASPA